MRGLSGRSGTGRCTLRDVGMGWETLLTVRDGLGDPRGGLGRVQWTFGELRDG